MNLDRRVTQGILLVDDNEDFGLTTAELLRTDGYVVTYASTGEAAFNHLRTGYLPNLILLDWRLGSKSGGEFLDAIRSHPLLSSIPVIVLSGLRPMGIGWLVFAEKTLDHDKLLELVKRYAR